MFKLKYSMASIGEVLNRRADDATGLDLYSTETRHESGYKPVQYMEKANAYKLASVGFLLNRNIE